MKSVGKIYSIACRKKLESSGTTIRDASRDANTVNSKLEYYVHHFFQTSEVVNLLAQYRNDADFIISSEGLSQDAESPHPMCYYFQVCLDNGKKTVSEHFKFTLGKPIKDFVD